MLLIQSRTRCLEPQGTARTVRPNYLRRKPDHSEWIQLCIWLQSVLPNRDGQGDEPHPVVPGLNEHQDVVLAILLCSIDRVLDIGRSANPVDREL